MEPMQVVSVGPEGPAVVPTTTAVRRTSTEKAGEAMSLSASPWGALSQVNVLREVQAGARRVADEAITWTGRLEEGHPAFAEFGRDPEFVPEKFVSDFVGSTRVSPMVVLVGLLYLKRVMKKHAGLRISSTNASRLVLVACTSAAKYMDDQALRYTNVHWTYLTGQWLSARKFGYMEREFLGLLEFDLAVSVGEMREFCRQYGVSVPVGEREFCE